MMAVWVWGMPSSALACEVDVDVPAVQAAARRTWEALESVAAGGNRARLSHLLPDRFTVDAGARWLADGRRETVLTEDLDAVGTVMEQEFRSLGRDDSDRWYEVRGRLEWRLTGLVYDPDTRDVERRLRQNQSELAELLADIADLWWRWKEASLLCGQDPAAAECLQEERWRGHIDALTEGWLTERCGAQWVSPAGESAR
jgi:hypothetical protein